MKRLCLILLMTACSIIHAQQSPPKQITVFAAASLNDAFKALAQDFEKAHSDVTVAFNFAGSQQLVGQIAEGAAADVFASANFKQMFSAVATGRVDSGAMTIFARNRLVVVTPGSGTAIVASLNDLAKPHVKVVLAARAVPVGQYALDFLDKCSKTVEYGPHFKDQTLANIVSYEENVKAVLAKVVLDECDAGIVYTTDVSGIVWGRARSISIPDSLNIIAEYPIAALKDSKMKESAEQFVRYVCSEDGRRTLSAFGFMTEPRR